MGKIEIDGPLDPDQKSNMSSQKHNPIPKEQIQTGEHDVDVEKQDQKQHGSLMAPISAEAERDPNIVEFEYVY